MIKPAKWFEVRCTKGVTGINLFDTAMGDESKEDQRRRSLSTGHGFCSKTENRLPDPVTAKAIRYDEICSMRADVGLKWIPGFEATKLRGSEAIL